MPYTPRPLHGEQGLGVVPSGAACSSPTAVPELRGKGTVPPPGWELCHPRACLQASAPAGYRRFRSSYQGISTLRPGTGTHPVRAAHAP